MILVIIAAYLAYKKATATGRNGWLWAFITSAAFIGTQFIVSLGGGLSLGILMAAMDWPESILDTYGIAITIIAVVSSFIVMWLILRYLDKVPDNGSYMPPPPPPPSNFN
jgi:hypothetical protein